MCNLACQETEGRTRIVGDSACSPWAGGGLVVSGPVFRGSKLSINSMSACGSISCSLGTVGTVLGRS